MKSREHMLLFCRESLGLSPSDPMEFFPLPGRGSDRAFFRLKYRSGTAILVSYDPKRIENAYYADIANFLAEIRIPVPRVIRHDPAAFLMILEDLGEEDLWSYRKTSWEIRGPLYQKTLAVVHRLHSFPEKEFPERRIRLTEPFGPDLYRWERDYFQDHFVREVCGIELDSSFERELESELSALAERLARNARSLVHRDLQSQNVMIRGGTPFLIDFQGLRFGNLFYDLGSLLCDPYADLSDQERDDLLSFYCRLSKRDLGGADFRHAFWEAASQRLMQALGAYGFLGLRKGLGAFLEHIPAGLQNLHVAVTRVNSLPLLRELSLKCLAAIRAKNRMKG